jgi:hypothetical protein
MISVFGPLLATIASRQLTAYPVQCQFIVLETFETR